MEVKIEVKINRQIRQSIPVGNQHQSTGFDGEIPNDRAGKANMLNKYCYSLFSDIIIPYDNLEIFSILTLAAKSKYV